MKYLRKYFGTGEEMINSLRDQEEDVNKTINILSYYDLTLPEWLPRSTVGYKTVGLVVICSNRFMPLQTFFLARMF